MVRNSRTRRLKLAFPSARTTSWAAAVMLLLAIGCQGEKPAAPSLTDAAANTSPSAQTTAAQTTTSAAPPTSTAAAAGSSKGSIATNGAAAQPANPEPAEKIDKSSSLEFELEELLAARLPQEELDAGWIRLFDGQTLFGWTPASRANWRVEEGCIVADAGEEGLLCTSCRFADYEIMLEFQASERTNSGVFFRTLPKVKDAATECYELNIAPTDNPFPTASLVNRVKVEPETIGPLDHAEWHRFHALIDNDHIQVWIDGKNVVNYHDPNNLQSGLIGLQYREGPVRFRDIKLRPILLQSILPAKNLDEWKASADSQAKFRLDDQGAVEVEGGKGHLELKRLYKDFCLQFQVKTLAENTNTGLFFRCLPDEDLNGYEFQINHGWKGDRRTPVDSGTGAIFRRVAARAVLSDDQKWAHATLVADGPNFASWVEGIQVVAWTDTRAPDPNPRRGLSTEAGTIMLQGHDADTHALFQNMKVGELATKR